MLSNREAEVIKLLGWCKSIPQSMADFPPDAAVWDSACIETLVRQKLVYRSRQDESLRLTEVGSDVAAAIGRFSSRDKYRCGSTPELLRRNQNAEILLTAYMAGMNVFADSAAALSETGRYLPSFAIRRKKKEPGNLLGYSRMSGIANTEDRIFVFYHIGRIDLCVHPISEVDTARRITARVGSNPSAVIFAGESYDSLASAVTLRSNMIRHANGYVSYRTAYDAFDPVYLMPCNPDGAAQLRILSEADYRARLTRTVLGGLYAPPPEALPLCDGLVLDDAGSTPMILAIDMDAKRIRAAAVKSESVCGKRLHVFARKCQIEALKVLLAGFGLPLFSIPDEAVLEAFGWSSLLPESPLGFYTTPNGGVITDETIRHFAQARRVGRKKKQTAEDAAQG